MVYITEQYNGNNNINILQIALCSVQQQNVLRVIILFSTPPYMFSCTFPTVIQHLVKKAVVFTY